MAKIIKLAWRNMWRNWRRTAIALVAIVLGLVLLLLLSGMINGSDQAIFGNAVKIYGGAVKVHAPGYREKLNRAPLLPLEHPDQVVQVALAQPTVMAAAKRIYTGGIVAKGSESQPVMITAIQPSVEAPISVQAANVVEGRFLLDGEGDAIFIGKALADELDLRVGDRVTLLGQSRHETMRQRTVTVVGIYSLGAPDLEKSAVFITLEQAQRLFNLPDQVTEVAISLTDVAHESTVLNALQAALPGYEVDSWKTLRPEITETMVTKQVFVTIIGVIVIMIASIGILNLQLMAVFERTREMGVLAALGMKGRQIMALFLVEGTLIGVVGAVVGCLAGVGLVELIRLAGGIDFSFAAGMGEVTALMGDRLIPSLSTLDVVGRGLIVAIIAALASLYPAWQAARKEPTEALRHL
ncbi:MULTISPECIES: ABC transporter permease [Caldilinea]|jgi:ABC-type lipoprotein release transport system permease subunit|uniref:Lipoprotein releasing system transmembrane protein LolC n=1 Tax=Caldilinea aerophila (strain DSM 14535 / JCM 11387 / NBRC 104270 / STL-6-O1) TaxID=926550 RepID=I0I8Z7_CALAS|nr:MULTISPECIES: FtsX-like permease family protein [Caldilinea]BAM01735.1 lipoprotein releasing system transmembrane protein LolC [Caldilinea aerophila DSM 14535 = NBRC 104270]GIV73072.1 MAG: ABC transporter permease [Caldilinea sp.]